jgi:rRNA-processing protein FCF1
MNYDPVLSLLAKYKSRGAVVDTNLVLLLVVGTYNIERISGFKRTVQYTPQDFHLLSRVLARLDRRVTTPNIVTEADNLSRQLPENEHDAVSGVLTGLCSSFFEIYERTHDATADPLYSKLGLTDCVTMRLAKERLLVITDDFALANRIQKAGCDAININHIRKFA